MDQSAPRFAPTYLMVDVERTRSIPPHRADADVLAARLHGTVAPGGELVYEVRPENPFALLGGLGS